MSGETTSSFVPKMFLWLGLIAGAALTVFAGFEWRFYFASLAQQPLHPHFETLRSSGRIGLSFGLIGTGMMLMNLTYLVRKSQIHVAWLGPLRHWMAFHVFTGLLGGGLVLLHSAFHTRSAVGGLSFWCTAVVVATGLVGRYIYAHVPRSLEGRELEMEELRARLDAHLSGLAQLGLPGTLFQPAAEGPASGERGLAAAFRGVIAGDRAGRREFHLLKRTVLASRDLQIRAGEILPLAKQYYRERGWLARYHELRALMSSWRFLHRWFAITLLVAMVFHIFLAVRLGDLWIFR